ncbi:hypothetical protein CJ202_10320 [Corynebacterium parakroppenstedtii]|nr:hypothetical protein CJ202_10320 [Corynebacterium kroppenstedtii]
MIATHVPSRRDRGRVFSLARDVGRDSLDGVAVVARWGVRIEESTRVLLQYSLKGRLVAFLDLGADRRA